ncbi:MAG: DEAD/DEAH box helicase, partial [Gammaproteobacteria bacterium]|nr:DEAD/DEAH box helicase [Gammaproteobacteria bacterium]
MASFSFHPAVESWFEQTFTAPTSCQREAWPAIQSRRHTLIAAPTGSGKTLAAFLCAIDVLLKEGLANGGALDDVTRVLYVSPLKALSNDVQKNLQEPLAGIRQRLAALDLPDVEIRAWVRTGDTPPAERNRMRRQPPHIIVTTPESLYILLTSESGRAMLADVNTVIVDEIHALVTNKRGAHLSLSLERLAALSDRAISRIGLSATQKPMREIVRFLVGGEPAPCKIVDTGHVRERDLAVEITASPLQSVMATEVWQEVYERLGELIETHRTTLIFVNTRRLAERAARHLAERIGADAVTAHHGSLAREHRLDAEQRLKSGGLRALVATASLELGIDVGEVDLVCQIGSPRAISTLLQRVGRSGHALKAVPKGRLFPTSRDELVECVALLEAVRRGELETLTIPAEPLDVLAQQIVAEVASREWHEDALYRLVTGAWPYRNLARAEFEQVVDMLATGFSTRRGRRSAYLHRDAVNHRLRGRRGARLTALMNGGAIPDQFDYDVVLEPEEQRIGTLNEDFAFESLPGDIFQLGNTSYRILKVEQGKVRVEDARGQPPNIPFWFGEAPGRSDELSVAVSRLRGCFNRELEAGLEAAAAWAERNLALNIDAARQLVDYLGTARAALGTLPTQKRVVFERFFDEAGDMHLVIHSPFGSRINRGWGLALRKRFCRQFNFELQAAALEDSIVLSLGATHSFALDEVARYLKPNTVREILTQALLAAPMFPTHWRWSANIALAVRRNRSSGRVPAQLQRMDAEDLIAVVFPDQLACQDNLTGYRRIPDHPLVKQTVADCLHDVMDVVGLERLLGAILSGQVEVMARDLSGPSPLAQEILSARPYAFLDDAPAEERRTSAVQARPFLNMETAEELGRLDPSAIDEVRREAWPDARNPDELHDALVLLGYLTEDEGVRGTADTVDASLAFGWTHWYDALATDARATRVTCAAGQVWWVAAERLTEVLTVYPNAVAEPAIAAVPMRDDGSTDIDADDALRELLRGRMEGLGPVSVAELAATFGLPATHIETGLRALEGEGFVMQGRFTGTDLEWCERRLLARIHRHTIKRLRREIEPVSRAVFMRYLLDRHRVTPGEQGEGPLALQTILQQLEGFEAPAAAWEAEILPTRLIHYDSRDLDGLCLSGRWQWARLHAPRERAPRSRAGPLKTTPITLVQRTNRAMWRTFAKHADAGAVDLSAAAKCVFVILSGHGALFFDELQQ